MKQDILTFLNNYYCVNYDSMIKFLRQLRIDFGNDSANELENIIYEYYLSQKKESEDEE